MDPRQFYDGLAATYHALYPDWEVEVTEQAESLLRLLSCPAPGSTIADPACGIGTQLLGMSAAGMRVLGSDVSRAAVLRARQECADRGLPAAAVAADMRALPWADASADALVCADNAIAHLLTDEDAFQAFSEFHRVLRPGGRAVVTIRDYDALLESRPGGTEPQLMMRSTGGRIISFQLWRWRPGADIYDLEHFQIDEDHGGNFQVTVRRTALCARARRHLTELAREAGFGSVRWHLQGGSSYFQPAMTAARP